MGDERKIFVVEGPNYAGKSTLAATLKSRMPGATVVEFHDFYHMQLLTLGNVPLDQVLSGDIPDEVREQLLAYNLARAERAVREAEACVFDSYIFERLHGTDIVYAQLQFGIDRTEWYHPLEEALNKLDAQLLMTTVGDEALADRMAGTLKAERIDPFNRTVPKHVRDYDLARRKRDLYLQWFERSAIAKKHIVDSVQSADYDACIARALA